MGVYFGEPERTVPDPYFAGEGPDRTGCRLCGECMTGCRYGAKNTLDRNYLHLAERRGAVIHPETRVVDVRPMDGGGYEVHTVRSTRPFARKRRVLRARGVVFSAGAIGTVRLLLACKASGSLPRLGDQLGNYVRTNSEALLACGPAAATWTTAAGSRSPRASRRTPTPTSRWCATAPGTTPCRCWRPISPAAVPLAQVVALAREHAPPPGGLPPRPRAVRLGAAVGGAARDAAAREPHAAPAPAPPVGEALASEIDGAARPPSYMPLANAIARRMADRMDGIPQSGLHEVLLGASSTAHILGGATMGEGPAEGVCDAQGRVFGHEGLYVADGSLVPANLGVNPALTITALAEHVMSGVPANPAGERKPAPLPGARERLTRRPPAAAAGTRGDSELGLESHVPRGAGFEGPADAGRMVTFFHTEVAWRRRPRGSGTRRSGPVRRSPSCHAPPDARSQSTPRCRA